MSHPILKLTASVFNQDYAELGYQPPSVEPSGVTVVTDTGAQSCLWGLQDFLKHKFARTDLIPVQHSLYAANQVKINVVGAYNEC